MKIIYLDSNATTRMAPEVREAMAPFFDDLYGNPSSLHAFAGATRHAVDRAREEVADFLGARPDEVVFTSGGTESDNAALRGVLEALPERRHLVTTKVEHPAVLNLARRLARRGYAVTELGVDAEGHLDLEELRAALRPDTALVSIMAANNETGVVFPITEAAALVKERGILFHCDAVQAAGRVELDMAAGPVDLLSLSGHKIHGPKGIGVLFIRRKTRLAPWLVGGHQERDRRAGTENVPGIVGLGAACGLAFHDLQESMGRIGELRDRLEQAILARTSGAHRNGDPARRIPNTSSLRFEGVESQDLLLHLSEKGLCASNGSACATGTLEPSHVLAAMGIPPAAARGALRLSLSRFNTAEEIDLAAEIIPQAVARLRALAPPSHRRAERR